MIQQHKSSHLRVLITICENGKKDLLTSAGLCTNMICTGFEIRRLTRWTEASIYAVIVTHLASLGVTTGVSTGTTAFLILHVERACFCYSTQQFRDSDSDINTVKTSRLEDVNVSIAVLTTQLCSLPLLWFSACMSALTGVLGYGWTQAWRTAAVTVAQVFHTGFDEGVSIN